MFKVTFKFVNVHKVTFDPDLVICTLVTYHMKKLLITFETLQVLALNDNRGQSCCQAF